MTTPYVDPPDDTPPGALPTRWPGVYQQPGSDIRFFGQSGIQAAVMELADKIPPGDQNAFLVFGKRGADGKLEAHVAFVTKQFGDHLKASVAATWKAGEGMTAEIGSVISF